MREKAPIPRYWWVLWLITLAGGLFVFYVLFTPVWIGIRLVSWFAERRNHVAAENEMANASSGDRPSG
ncbi:MAG: hypothetical protein ACRDNR_04070 [Gaiellaceae bacterium]